MVAKTIAKKLFFIHKPTDYGINLSEQAGYANLFVYSVRLDA